MSDSPFALCFEAPPERAGQRHPLSENSTTVGRAEGCGLRIDDPRVSRRHARLVREGEQLVIEDLGSPNGTVVNGLRVGRQVLQDGDLLVLGKFRLRVEAPRSVPGAVIRPVADMLPPSLEGMGKRAFYEALGVGDDTVLEVDGASLIAKTRQFAVLYEVSRTLRAAHTPHEMLDRVLELILEVTGGDRGYALAAPGPERGLEDDPTLPPSKDVVEQPQLLALRSQRRERGAPPPLSGTVARHVLTERCAVLSHDPADDTRFAASESLFLSRTEALMAVPILLREEVLGALVVEGERRDVFEESDLELLTVVASTVGQTLANLRLAERREATIRALETSRARLIETRAQLVRAEQLAVVGRLASGLAHEVKNHLSPFLLADVLARRHPDDEDLQEAAEMMLEARQHILDLVSEVKGFARGAEGSSELRTQPTDLAQLAQAVVRFATCDAGVKRHVVEVVIEGEPWTNADVGRLRQVLVNLIKNAADALGEQRGGRIEVRVLEVSGTAYLEVWDNGPGVPEAARARLFEPFFSTKGEKGLGLGLDISLTIVRAHGGELEFESEPGRTCFRVRIPALPE